MSYIVIARKWRPQTFDDIVGQGHITTTLKNAVKNNRVAHAYLFCGPRGVGKTTTARILAKALNCEKGPTPNPCNKCVSCVEITEGRNLDVLEIDGATNRGIDEIKNLKDNVKFSPQHGKFKVYVIDEVHMLTDPAFNALLKTLEEPPNHVKFIFATTAAHEVIPTILSRCQRFNFHKLSSQDILGKLRIIADQEKIKIEEAAILGIAKAAAGSMRDAESLMDQLATYCKNSITANEVNRLLGVVEQQTLSEFSKAIMNKDTVTALKTVNKVIDEGKDPAQFILGLLEYFRCAMILKESKDMYFLLELTEEEANNILSETKSLTKEDILYILYNLINTNSMLRKSNMPKIALELLTVKITRKESIVSLEEIMHRLTALEREERKPDNQTDDLQKLQKQTDISGPLPEDNTAASSPARETVKPLNSEDEIAASTEQDAAFYRVREVMPQLIKNIKQEKIYIASCLSEGKLLWFRNNVLTIGFFKRNSFHKESLEKPQNKKLIEDHLSRLLNEKIGVEFIIMKDEQAGDNENSEEKKNREGKDSLKKAMSDPIVKTALDIFDGNIMKFM